MVPGKGVKLMDGSTLECDVVVCGTGFSKSYDYLPKDTRDSLNVQVPLVLVCHRTKNDFGVQCTSIEGKNDSSLKDVSQDSMQRAHGPLWR
jgi:hypothetical protein